MKTFKLSNELINNISDLILKKNNKEIKNIVKNLHYADLAELVSELSFNDSIYLIKLIDSDKTSDVLTELDDDVREKILKELSEKEIAVEIKELDSDDAVDILSELSEEKKEKVISLIKDENIEGMNVMAGASISHDTCTQDLSTPILWAALNSHMDTLDLLLQNGGDAKGGPEAGELLKCGQDREVEPRELAQV